MELITNNAIAHRLIKAQHKEGTHQLRTTCLPESEALTRLINEIHHAYAERTGKSHGVFEEDEINFPTVANLRAHFKDENINFVTTSHKLMDTLLIQSNSANLSTGGNILIADVSQGNNRWLIVAILTDKLGATIDENLNLLDSSHLDLSAMRFAGRVNITKWLNDDDRYVSFLKGASRDVSDYFQKFLGCTHTKALNKESQLLVKLVRKAVNSIEEATDEQRDTARKTIFDYLEQCAKDSEPFSIDTMSNKAWPQNPDVLKSVLTDPDNGITDGFVPQRRALKGLIRFEARNPKKWQIQFEREAVTSGDVQLNDNNQLVLNNVPADVLKRYNDEFNPQ